ncbi:MAG: hypothetical protein ACM3PE_10985 [Deltaproteobacteria bacterium]
MNEDKLISMLGSLDDDLIDNVIDDLMKGVDCDLESINNKAMQKLAKHNGKAKLRHRLPYVAAVLLLFVCINTVYADEISQAFKSFFNKTPVYETMVEGKAYYLKDPQALSKDLTIDSMMVAEGRIDMNLTAADASALENIKIIPKNQPGTEYTMGGIGQDGDNKYFLSFMNAKEQNYDIKPFQAFDLQIGGKTYTVSLDEAKSLGNSPKLAASDATANKIDLVTVGANSIEKNGKQAVQLIAAFKNQDMKLDAFGKPKTMSTTNNFENLGKDGMVGSGGAPRPEPIYATDQAGARHQLTKPANPKAWPITTFDTDASIDSKLTVNVPALLATYEKSDVAHITVNIPKEGERALDHEVDLFAQKAVFKNIKRLSPTSAELTFALNTGADENIKISCFDLNGPDIKKYTAKFNGDTAVVTLEFATKADAYDVDISWPTFVMNGNWTMNLK